MKNKFYHYFKNKYIIGAIVLVIVIIISISFSGKSDKSIEIITVEKGDVIEKIELTGSVKSLAKAELSFENAGVVKTIKYKVGDGVVVGDSIVSLDSANSFALLQGAEANLMAEQAYLAELQKGLRSEEVSVEDSKLKLAQTNYDDARVGLINAFHDSYIKSTNAVFNYADTFFNNPQSIVPQINVRVENYSQDKAVGNSRTIVGEKFKDWKRDLDNITLTTDPVAYIDKIHSYLESVKTLMSQLSVIVSSLSPGNSGQSQAQIDNYNSIMNNALSTFNSAVSSLATGEAAFRTNLSDLSLSKDQFNLKKAGSSIESLQIQTAKVAQAQANVSNYQAELSKKKLVSPIVGIVGKIDSEVGEFVAAGKVVAVIVSDLFKIEVYVPESDITKIAVGNPASIYLDAYDSSTIFKAHVSGIDLAETIVEGVPTYKVTLIFDEKDSRIRSGMTANIEIITQSKEGVIYVPFRAIQTKGNQKFVRVLKNDDINNYTDINVETGVRGSDGRMEIISGINAGSKVLIPKK